MKAFELMSSRALVIGIFIFSSQSAYFRISPYSEFNMKNAITMLVHIYVIIITIIKKIELKWRKCNYISGDRERRKCDILVRISYLFETIEQIFLPLPSYSSGAIPSATTDPYRAPYRAPYQTKKQSGSERKWN